eukprot:476085_1
MIINTNRRQLKEVITLYPLPTYYIHHILIFCFIHYIRYIPDYYHSNGSRGFYIFLIIIILITLFYAHCIAWYKSRNVNITNSIFMTTKPTTNSTITPHDKYYHRNDYNIIREEDEYNE